MDLFEQLPRLSAYDPGATGEGGLDPLGLSAIADRLADVLAPGVRARMNQPHFVTISAAGAIACQQLHGSEPGKTTVDIAFEWLVVEAIVGHSGKAGSQGLPGSQKAARALALKQRLSPSTYLSGPRVFGFTGIYRPFSRDAGVLTSDDLPDTNAPRLVRAWERDHKLNGFVDNESDTPGGKFRKRIADACKQSLDVGACAGPIKGDLPRRLSESFAPGAAKSEEKRILHELIVAGKHEIRNEITAKLVARPPPEGVPQKVLAQQLVKGASMPTKRALQAAIDYEDAATALDLAFRRFLAYTVSRGRVISKLEARLTPGLKELAPKIGDLVKRAKASVDQIGDTELSNQTERAFQFFSGAPSPAELLDLLIERHEEVQSRKKKLMWIDQIGGDWIVRIPYGTENDDLNVDIWAHPMRLKTLATFLAETAS